MKLKCRCLVLFIGFILFFSGYANANSCIEGKAGGTEPAHITKVSDLKKVGEAKFSVLFWDIYKSKLFTSSGQYPKALDNETVLYQITYLRDITRKDLIEKTIEQWQYQKVESDLYSGYIPKLENIWPNISEGDNLTLVIDKNVSYFYYNAKCVGIISEHEFGRLFLDIWLSQNTSQPKLRSQLLGKS